jgi:hypothetical protein
MLGNSYTHTHTHTHTYMYTYVYVHIHTLCHATGDMEREITDRVTLSSCSPISCTG